MPSWIRYLNFPFVEVSHSVSHPGKCNIYVTREGRILVPQRTCTSSPQASFEVKHDRSGGI